MSFSKPLCLEEIKSMQKSEIGPIVEPELFNEMTERQKILYNTIKQKLLNNSDLFKLVDSKVKIDNLMNL